MLRKNGNATMAFTTLIMLITVAHAATGQDVVVLKTENGKITKRNGQIVEWKGDQLSLKSKTRTRQFDAERIVEIQTQWPAELVDAREQMASGRFRDAIPVLVSARKAERRKWVQQIISAEIIQCLDAAQLTEASIVEFLELFLDDPQTRFFHLLPIPWSSSVRYSEAGRFGTKTIESKNNLLALISSSLMLTSNQREKAQQRLEQLTNDSDIRIAQLATTQLWRSEVLNADANMVARWQRQISKLPEELRAGPLMLLAQAQNRIDEKDQAVINYMKLPILHPEKKTLCALALYRCGEILHDTGQLKQARLLRQELFQKYPESQAASWPMKK